MNRYIYVQVVVRYCVVEGFTAEEFISRTQSNAWPLRPSSTLATGSRYDALRKLIALRVGVSDAAVDLFSVVNHRTQPRTVDIHYSVLAERSRRFYYRPAKLNGLLLTNRYEVSHLEA